MALDIEKLRLRMERENQKTARQARKAQAAAADFSEASRKRDNHRKIVDGVTAAYGCKISEEYRRLHERFRDEVLYLPKDRAVVGLPLLAQQEVERREAASGNARRRQRKEPDVSAALPDRSADTARASEQNRETEDA